MDVLENLIKFIEEEGKVELTEAFKTKLKDSFDVIVAEKEGEIDDIKEVLKEAKDEITNLAEENKNLKESTLDEVKSEVESHKEELSEKVSSYLNSTLEELIPQEIIESAAKLEAYEPIVEKVKEVFVGYGVDVSSEAQEVLKEAKSEITGLKDSYDKTVTEKLALEKEVADFKAEAFLKEKCDGLTPEQEEKIAVIFKGASVEEIEEKFERISDIVIGEKKTNEEDEDDEDDDSSDDKDEAKKKKMKEKKENKDVKEIVQTTNSDVLNEEEDLGQRLLV